MSEDLLMCLHMLTKALKDDPYVSQDTRNAAYALEFEVRRAMGKE